MSDEDYQRAVNALAVMIARWRAREGQIATRRLTEHCVRVDQRGAPGPRSTHRRLRAAR
jgi:hypothetical protein